MAGPVVPPIRNEWDEGAAVPNDTRDRLAADLTPLIARALERGSELRAILRNMEIDARKSQ